MNRSQFLETHKNLYSEYFDELVSMYYDLDTYEAHDSINVDVSSDNPKDDFIKTMRTEMESSEHMTMMSFLEGFVESCMDMELDDEQQSLYDKACVMYASVCSKEGTPLFRRWPYPLCDIDVKDRFTSVNDRLEAIDGSSLGIDDIDSFSDMDTNELVKTWRPFVDSIIKNKYPDLLELESVKTYEAARIEYHRDMPKKVVRDRIYPGRIKDVLTDIKDIDFTENGFTEH